MRKVPVDSLKPGMRVAKPVFDDRGTVLLNYGVELKEEYIKNLRKFKIPAVYIIDGVTSDVWVEDVILDETRQKAKESVRRFYENIKHDPHNITGHSELKEVMDEIIEQLLSQKNLIVNLSDIKNADSYTFAHSVNVAVLTIIVAISMGYSKKELKKIGLGAFLHDLGKIKIPSTILNKQGALLPQEFEEVKKHPVYGYDLLKLRDFMDSSSAVIVYQHHERVNGDGYPNGLKEREINYASKICSVVDVYDALVSDRPYRSALPPHKALEILETGGEEFDLEILQKFFQHVAAYPVGTLLKLSTGEIGVVVNNTAGFPTRPKVRVVCYGENFEPVEYYEVDLVDRIDVVVERVLSEEELPERIKRGVEYKGST